MEAMGFSNGELDSCGNKIERAARLPDNLRSHRNSWIAALERLVELEPESGAPDEDEKGFWRHELKAMRDMYADLDKLDGAK